MKARIAEVFQSIQGEGIYIGEEQLFVRFFGCNLNCKFCDTKLDRFSEYEPAELLEEIALYPENFHSVSFTGGEPLLQYDFLKEVLALTRQKGYKNYLETNGVLFAELEKVIDYLDIVAMDLKLPSSTGMGNLWNMHRKFLQAASKKEVFLKAVICRNTSEDDLIEGINLIKEVNNAAFLVLQPNSHEEGDELTCKIESLRNLCLDNKVAASVIPQIHKIVGMR